MRIFLALLLFSAIPAFGQETVIDRTYRHDPEYGSKAYTESRFVLYGGLAFDLGTSEVAMRAGAEEMNPILGQNRYRRVGLAVGLTIATDLLTRSLARDGHSKLATTLNFIAGGLHVGAGAWNIKQTRPTPLVVIGFKVNP
jgi:hypothetical protein